MIVNAEKHRACFPNVDWSIMLNLSFTSLVDNYDIFNLQLELVVLMVVLLTNMLYKIIQKVIKQ